MSSRTLASSRQNALPLQRKRARIRDGLVLPYLERGDADGIPVIFLHGYTDSCRSFANVLEHLPRSLRGIALTQRGHGDASRPVRGYRPADFAGDLAAFLDVLGIDDAVIAGHCMGGLVAQRFAIDHPHRVRGLALLATFPTLRDNPVVQALWDEDVSKLTDSVAPDFVRAFQESTLARPVPPEFLEMVVAESLKVPPRVWRNVLRDLFEEDVGAGLGRIASPTLIAWGDRDSLVPRSVQSSLAASVPNSRMVVYEGAGHGFHWEDPARFAADLAAFVRELPQRR